MLCALADYLVSSLQPWLTDCSGSAGLEHSCRNIELEIREETRNYSYEFRKPCIVSDPTKCDCFRFEQVWLAGLSSSLIVQQVIMGVVVVGILGAGMQILTLMGEAFFVVVGYLSTGSQI